MTTTAPPTRESLTVDQALQQAITHHQAGDLQLAEQLYRAILQTQSNHFDSLHLLGVIAHQTKNYQFAVELIDQAINLYPHNVAFYLNRGSALKALKQLDAAIINYDKAIELDPDYAEAYNNRGNALLELKQLDAAIINYDKAIELNPDYAEAYNNRGNALQALTQLDAAINNYDKAIELKPDFVEAYNNRGNALQAVKRLDAAIINYDKAIELNPDFAEAYNNRGNTLLALKRLDAAIINYDKAIELNPDYSEAYNNLGNALQALKRLDAAIINYDKAVVLNPDYAEAYCNRGSALQKLKLIDAAINNYDKAIELNPDYAEAYFNKSLALLLEGSFDSGWELYEWRWELEDFKSSKTNFTQPLWLGNESLNGKTILLHSEQGLGDAIQYCRYVKLVAELGARVILEVPGALLNLFKDLDGVAELVAKGNAPPSFDFQCSLLSLPLAFKTNISNIPTFKAYLRSDPYKVTSWSRRLGHKKGKRIGLVWSGNIAQSNDHNRSFLLSQLLPYLPNDHEYVSLQKELREIDNETLRKYNNIRHYGDELNDFTDTAALCELMDVVISVCTSVAHLAGALGKQTWVLLSFCPSERWLLGRNDSVWYPSVKLYRQNAVGDWSNVFHEVQTDLLQIEA